MSNKNNKLKACSINSKLTVSQNELPKEFFDDDMPIGVLQENGSIKPTSFVYKNILEFLRQHIPGWGDTSPLLNRPR